MSSGDIVINSYDAGKQPYIHDPKRGKWEGKWDFYLASIINTFGMRNFVVFTLFINYVGSAYISLPLLISTLFFVIPVFFVQSFVGQFSSTGYISIFRISPLFKGMGYVILALNLSSMIYSSSVSSYPLLFFLKSFQLNTTWMYCDNSWNTKNCSETRDPTSQASFPYVPFETNATESLEPEFEYYYYGVLKLAEDSNDFNVSYTVILGELFVWIVVGCVVIRGITMVSRFLRYTVITTLVIAAILLIRVCCLPNLETSMANFFGMKQLTRLQSPAPWLISAIVCSSILGRGWGTTLTMASFQSFSCNVEKYSYIIPLIMTAISFILGCMLNLMDQFISNQTITAIRYFDHDSFEYLFIVPPHVFGKIEASQLWSILFYLMLFFSELSLIVIQAFSIITSVADEFVELRHLKYEITIGLCIFSFLFSTLFATEYMAIAYKQLLQAGFASQMLICFLEILMIIWVYGRNRFLQDIRFMLVRHLSSWKFYIIRFVTPLFIFLSLITNAVTAYFQIRDEPFYLICFVFIIKWLPWISIPGYIIAKLVTTIGTIPERFRRCTKPNDWYPADPTDKLRYESALGVSDISQQLLEMNDNCIS